MRKTIYIIIVFLLALSTYSEVTWEVLPESTNVVSQKSTQLKMTATWTGFETVSVRTPRLKELKGALVKDIVSYNESKPGPGGTQHTATYVIDLLITNAPGTVVKTGLIEVMTRGVEDQEFSTATIPGVTYNVRTSPLLFIIPAAALLFILIWAVLSFFFKKLRPKKETKNEESLEEAFLRELTECKELRMKGENSTYFEKCESILRRYLRQKYAIANLDDLGEKEIMEKGLDQHLIRTARELCSVSFNVRYAGYQPSSQEEKHFYDFVNELLLRNRPCSISEEDELYIK